MYIYNSNDGISESTNRTRGVVWSTIVYTNKRSIQNIKHLIKIFNRSILSRIFCELSSIEIRFFADQNTINLASLILWGILGNESVILLLNLIIGMSRCQCYDVWNIIKCKFEIGATFSSALNKFDICWSFMCLFLSVCILRGCYYFRLYSCCQLINWKDISNHIKCP